jgi:uncharacterized OsmC-like protein
MISAQVDLTQPLSQQRQFVARTGSEHYLLLDDSAGGTGPKPIELVAIGLAGCTAFDVITILRQKYHQRVTGYEVRVEADQAERPPQVFTALRIHHVVRGFEIDAEKTAKSIMERSQVRFDTGLVVESDLLSAKVRLASREQELIRARNNLALAHAQLNTAMGVPADSLYQPTDSLADRALAVAPLADQERQALTTRPDLKRIEAQQSAQELSVAIAKSSFGPRLNAFAGWEMDNPTFLAGGGGNNWLGGIELQIDLFQGGAKRAALSRERALAEKIAALKQAANDAVRLEVRQAYYDQDFSRQQVEVARAAISQAEESLCINQDRYDNGLLTITDLLGAEEAARRSQAEYWLLSGGSWGPTCGRSRWVLRRPWCSR